MGQRGLADARHVLDQQVPAGQQAGHAVAHLGRFSDDHRVKLIEERFEFLLCFHGTTLSEFASEASVRVNKTGYFTHPDCRQPRDGARAIPNAQSGSTRSRTGCWPPASASRWSAAKRPQASVSDIELAHGRMHVAAMRGLGQELAEDIEAGGPSYAQIDPDTAMNVHTWNAMLRAAGAALAATDAVMAGELENAFCAVRPPGHHACRDRAMGFCFFNNIAIAAKYALERHGLKRVADRRLRRAPRQRHRGHPRRATRAC